MLREGEECSIGLGIKLGLIFPHTKKKRNKRGIFFRTEGLVHDEDLEDFFLLLLLL